MNVAIITTKERLALDFNVPQELTANITDAEATAAHDDLTAARNRGATADAAATVSVLIAARNALETQVIYTGS